MSTPKTYQEKVTEIAEVASEVLNEWSCRFIESVKRQHQYSAKQKAVIDKLYAEVCDSPP